MEKYKIEKEKAKERLSAIRHEKEKVQNELKELRQEYKENLRQHLCEFYRNSLGLLLILFL
jgi:uncharacterized protein (DUF3084 family)